MCGAAAAFLLFGSAGAHAQPFGSEDEVAAKNVFLAVTGALKCDGLAPVLSRIREYAQQNGVSIDSLRDQAEKYKNQRAYAVTIVDSHAKVGGLASLCKNIIQDFGPDGKLAGGLIAEVRQSAVGSAAVFDGAVPTPEAANPPRPPLRDLWLAAGATPGVLQTRELIALIASVFAVIAGYFSARKRAAEGARGSTIVGALAGGAVGGIAGVVVALSFDTATLVGRSIACTLLALPFSFWGSRSGRRKRLRAPSAGDGEQPSKPKVDAPLS
jgi:hypothetical protein